MIKHSFLSIRRLEIPEAWTYYSILEICFMLDIDYREMTIAEIIDELEDRLTAMKEQIVTVMERTPKNELRRHRMNLLHHNGKVILYCLEKAQELDEWLNGRRATESREPAEAEQEEAG